MLGNLSVTAVGSQLDVPLVSLSQANRQHCPFTGCRPSGPQGAMKEKRTTQSGEGPVSKREELCCTNSNITKLVL